MLHVSLASVGLEQTVYLLIHLQVASLHASLREVATLQDWRELLYCLLAGLLLQGSYMMCRQHKLLWMKCSYFVSIQLSVKSVMLVVVIYYCIAQNFDRYQLFKYLMKNILTDGHYLLPCTCKCCNVFKIFNGLKFDSLAGKHQKC